MIQTYVNGNIFTSNEKKEFADTMVVQDGKIIWIGKHNDLIEIQGERIDLQGRCVLPGLIDSHIHPLILADTAKQISCAMPNVRSIKDLIIAIRNDRDKQQEPQGILCWGYDENKLSEGRTPQRWDLDQAATDVPILARRICGHISVVNSFTLELASITRETPNPPGGEIERDDQGEPTGVLKENAQYLVRSYFPKKTIIERIELLTDISDTLLAYGITSVTDMDALEGFYEMYQAARERGYKQRTALYYAWVDNKKHSMNIEGMTDRSKPIFIAGVKLFGDGSISGQTAWIEPGYIDNALNTGISVTSEFELLEAADYAKEHKLQVSVHAMGNKACDQVIDTFYEYGTWLEDIPSVRIEHATLFSEHALDRASKAKIAFSSQPIFVFAEIESYLRGLGSDRTKQTYPLRTMIDKGVLTAISTDAPATAWAEPAHPFVNMKAAMTRTAYDGTDVGALEQMNITEAILMYTREAQKITGISLVGMLAEGYWADFIVLDQDILKVEPMQIDRVKVMETYIKGERVYKRMVD